MKKLVGLLVGLLMVFGVVGSASATPITLIDTTNFNATGTDPSGDLDGYGWGTVNKLDGITDYVAWTHHYTFVPAYDEILSGTLRLNLRDDGGSWDFWEFAFGWTESGEWDFGKVNTGVYSYNVGVSTLGDGAFSIVLASVGGDFYIDGSELSIKYDPVPEPATMLLFGLGLLGLAGVSRKKNN